MTIMKLLIMKLTLLYQADQLDEFPLIVVVDVWLVLVLDVVDVHVLVLVDNSCCDYSNLLFIFYNGYSNSR